MWLKEFFQQFEDFSMILNRQIVLKRKNIKDEISIKGQ